ncbi:LLM class flavin-dependent oxidoreductase [Streptomyces sp. NPDC097610]|uniref:LLM class flavin-dependent oxidoreductase n=1 Tax=Streptomyces sp. NPDC097610 TaxID=3157227 RepID=UPI00332DFDAF
MKTLIMCATNVAASPEERRVRRPIARDTDAYQGMLRSYGDIAGWADELGFDGLGSTEHHFQTEGGETIPNALLFYAKLAAQTERIMFVPLSIILPAQNPIRVAEDLALFSHMYPGRIGVGFARGYQTRWMQTLAQDDAVTSMQPDSDARNREIFDEYLSIVERAWDEDSFQHNGKHFQVPYPAEGIRNWALADWTRAYGSPDEVDAEGTVHKIGVLPKPLHRPTIFIPNTYSRQTAIDAARHGRTLLSLAGVEHLGPLTEQYRDIARENGRDLPRGEGVGIVRKIVLGDTFDEAFDLAVRTAGYWYQNFFQAFGINEAFRIPSDAPDRRLDLGDARALTRRMHETGALLCGTPDQVRDDLEKTVQAGGGRLDWLVWEFWAQALYGDDAPEIQRGQLKAYAEQIMPAFR